MEVQVRGFHRILCDQRFHSRTSDPWVFHSSFLKRVFNSLCVVLVSGVTAPLPPAYLLFLFLLPALLGFLVFISIFPSSLFVQWKLFKNQDPSTKFMKSFQNEKNLVLILETWIWSPLALSLLRFLCLSLSLSLQDVFFFHSICSALLILIISEWLTQQPQQSAGRCSCRCMWVCVCVCVLCRTVVELLLNVLWCFAG